ncbi:hypothetical protein ASF84_20440 [Pseudomonas sp. Leaf127]|uniref:hypothetical protein n=1 Tax=Pseudomonas sp. Leaf127 TaxID=1736267 RepID=UPI000703522D|nr:hypothetical protein [Pseudomonas sp. Leaf127]KQQ50646.1 hypothetical protein ASF84_20440 [Pseudomonas sp. Leaf127]MBD8492569.1 hypothetical protein [Pseudomonas syringae]
MKDPYAYGFYSACLALTVLVFAAFFSVKVGAVQAWQIIQSTSALLEALAAIGIAGVAFAAYSTWKHDVRQQKTLSIVWDASVAFREIEIGFSEWFFGPDAEQRAGSDSERLNAQLSTSSLGLAIRAFRKQCMLIDKVVLRHNWRWINYASELDMLVHALTRQIFEKTNKDRVSSGIVDFLYSAKGGQQCTQAQWEALLSVIEQELTALEELYA